MSEVSKVGSAPAGRHNCTGLPAPAGRHNHEMGSVRIGGEMTSHNCDGKSGINAIIHDHDHEMGPIEESDSRYEAWIRRGGYRFGKDPCGYDVLFEETRALTEDIEIEIRVIRWKIPKDTG
ncbi:hypothetical protein LCGC14_1601720 [marine sediment metagenome]|uniref:Uncharacterized protein n=1 Tax=marine sediment metagenome TaxID=412755 RepID=A0A0F9IBD4_9ZZZZ